MMHRAGQRCFELLTRIGSPQLLEQSYSPAAVFFLLHKYEKQTEYNMSQLFSMLLHVNLVILSLKVFPSWTRLLAELDKPVYKAFARVCKAAEAL